MSEANQKIIKIEFSIEKKFADSLYISPPQNQEYNKFLDNLESNLEITSLSNSFWPILIGDFSAKFASWYSKDNSTTEGLKPRLLTSSLA